MRVLLILAVSVAPVVCAIGAAALLVLFLGIDDPFRFRVALILAAGPLVAALMVFTVFMVVKGSR